jgi:hypothetical protein
VRGVAEGPPLRVELDHLVVAARTLAEGAAWCEASFGVASEPGGKHPAMGTHNRLLALSSARFPRAYLEIIAIDPEAPSPSQPRWFELDLPALRSAIATGPRLVHWVARSDDIEAGRAALRAAGHDPGPVTAAERMTPRGLLRWRITLPADGRRPAGGAIPLLIAWGQVHPVDALPPSGVSIESVQLGGVAAVVAALAGGTRSRAGMPAFGVVLAGPHGQIALSVLDAPAP